MIHRTAYHHRHGYIQPLYWNNDYVLYWHNFANWSSGRVAAVSGKIRWDGVLWTELLFIGPMITQQAITKLMWAYKCTKMMEAQQSILSMLHKL